MVSNVLAAAAILRRHFRRLRIIGLLGTAAAVGLIPLILYVPESQLAVYFLLSIVCLYAGRKVVQYFRGHGSLKQLAMEEHFLRYGATGGSMQKCVENDEHMWTRSRILAGLKAMASHRLPNNMMLEEKHRRILQRYRHAFQKMLPAVGLVDLTLLGMLLVVLLLASPSEDVSYRAMPVIAGVLAYVVALLAETMHLLVNRQLRDGLERLFYALSEWTVREGLEALSRSGAYSHQLLYFAQPWFAAVDREEEDAGASELVIGGDESVALPGIVGAEPDEEAAAP